MRSKTGFIALCLGCILAASGFAQKEASDDLRLKEYEGFVQRKSTLDRLQALGGELQEGFTGRLGGRGESGSNRSWGPEQVIGPPDTPSYGDQGTAWASLTPDAKQEWLLLEYAQPIRPVALKIYETYNPGAVTKITIFDPTGREVVVFRDRRFIPEQPDVNVLRVSLRLPYKITRVKLYLSSPDYPGWNEIDAVGLEDSNRKIQWAAAVLASSTYAEPEKQKAEQAANDPTQEANAALLQRILLLEEENRRLRDENAALKRQIMR